MQSTTNYLWLISDLLGQGATANVYRGRHKVGSAPGLSANHCAAQPLSRLHPLELSIKQLLLPVCRKPGTCTP